MRFGVTGEGDQLCSGAGAVALDDCVACAEAVVPVLLAALDDAAHLLGDTAKLILAVVDEVERLPGTLRRNDRAVAAPRHVPGSVVGVARVALPPGDVRERRDLLGV